MSPKGKLSIKEILAKRKREAAGKETPIEPPKAEAKEEPKAEPKKKVAASRFRQNEDGTFSPVEDDEEPKAEPKKKTTRKRRTKAQIAADKAVETASTAEEMAAAKAAQDEAYGRTPEPEPEADEPPADEPEETTARDKIQEHAARAAVEESQENEDEETYYGGYTLLVNAAFLKNAPGRTLCQHAADYTAELKKRIEESHDVEYWNSLQYREGEQLLAQMVTSKLHSHPPQGILMIDKESIEWKAAGSVFVEHANRVIGGSR